MLLSTNVKAQKSLIINNSVSAIQHGAVKGNADYNDWGLLVLVAVIGFSGFISRKKQLERNAD